MAGLTKQGRRGLAAAGIALALAGGVVFFGGDRRADVSPPPPASTHHASGAAIEPFLEASASAVGMKKEPDACAVVFDQGDAHISDDAIRLAVLGEDARTIADCRGRAIPVVQKKPVASVLASLAEADETLIDDAGLGGTVVARVSVGTGTSPCAGDVGVIALVSLRGRRLVVDALAPWEAPCSEGATEPLTVVDIGREHALFEEDGESSEHGSRVFSRVWLRRGDKLVRAGNVVTELTANERTMNAELRSSKAGLVATETWTLGDPTSDDARTLVRERIYTLRGDALVRSPESDP